MEPKTKLLDQMRIVLRLKHLSPRTEHVYINWAKRFIVFHGKRHPKDMGAEEIRAFLTHLALHRPMAASTQNVALNALLFLYRDVLKQALPALGTFERAKRPHRLPTVFAREEVAAVLTQMAGVHYLMASLLYGAGLRLMECLRLRVQDVDFACAQIVVRNGKGEQDRVTMMPRTLVEALQRHLTKVKRGCMRQTSPRDMATCICHTRWQIGTATLARPGCGSMSFLRQNVRSIRAQG